MASSTLAGTLRRSLLIKVISKPAPSREDVASVIELTASKVVEAIDDVLSRRRKRAEIISTAYLGWSGQVFKANPQGCPACNGTGYKGRISIHELMTNSEELTEAINKSAEVAGLKRIAMEGGMKTLHHDSMLKVKTGLTTLEEALANVPPDLIM